MLTCVKCEVRDAATIQERTGQDRPGRNTLVHNTYSCSVHKPHKHKHKHKHSVHKPQEHKHSVHKPHKHKHSVLKPQQHACTLCNSVYCALACWPCSKYNVLTELSKFIAELMCTFCVPGGGA